MLSEGFDLHNLSCNPNSERTMHLVCLLKPSVKACRTFVIIRYL